MLNGFETYIGSAAGLATSVMWTATSILFTAAARRLGPTMVNASRIAMAIVLLALANRVLSGSWLPGMETRQIFLLGLSGIVGLAIGDQALFTAFVLVGPRVSMLIMTTAPLFAAFFGWIALGETLSAAACGGIALTIAGVAWVVLERPSAESVTHHPYRARGVFLAFVAAACQAGGLYLSKEGIGHGWLPEDQHMNPLAATLVRMAFAGLGIAPILLWHRARERKRRIANTASSYVGSRREGWLFTVSGAVVGPFLGVWMSLVAADHAPVGVAQTLCSLAPVLILPFLVWIHKERVSPRAAVGALIAVCGVAILFFQPN